MNKDFPEAIYLDTNIISSLTLNTSNQSFLELSNILSKLNVKIPLLIPQTVSIEWFYHHYKAYDNKRLQTQTNLKELSQLLGKEQPKLKLPKDEFSQISKTYLSKLENLNIKVVKTPKNISINDLVVDAAFKIRPFEEKGEKGFRDSIILLTVLEDMKRRKINNAILITEDGIFKHSDVTKKISKYKVDLNIINSIMDAVNFLNVVLDSKAKLKIEEQKLKLLNYLNSNSKDLYKFINENASISEDFVTKGGFLSSKTEVFGRVEQILSFEPIKISSAYDRRELFDKKEYSKNIIPLNISVEINIKIRYSPYLVFNQPTVKVVDIDKFRETLQTATPKYYGDPIEKELTRNITVYALLDKNDDGEYKSLKYENVIAF